MLEDTVNCHLAEETSGLFLGAMPPEQFLDEFLPISPDAPSCPDSVGAFASVVTERTQEEFEMCTPFVSMVLVSVSVMPSLTFGRSMQ
jgi:hypothetical protein